MVRLSFSHFLSFDAPLGVLYHQFISNPVIQSILQPELSSNIADNEINRESNGKTSAFNYKKAVTSSLEECTGFFNLASLVYQNCKLCESLIKRKKSVSSNKIQQEKNELEREQEEEMSKLSEIEDLLFGYSYQNIFNNNSLGREKKNENNGAGSCNNNNSSNNAVHNNSSLDLTEEFLNLDYMYSCNPQGEYKDEDNDDDNADFQEGIEEEDKQRNLDSLYRDLLFSEYILYRLYSGSPSASPGDEIQKFSIAQHPFLIHFLRVYIQVPELRYFMFQIINDEINLETSVKTMSSIIKYCIPSPIYHYSSSVGNGGETKESSLSKSNAGNVNSTEDELVEANEKKFSKTLPIALMALKSVEFKKHYYQSMTGGGISFLNSASNSSSTVTAVSAVATLQGSGSVGNSGTAKRANSNSNGNNNNNSLLASNNPKQAVTTVAASIVRYDLHGNNIVSILNDQHDDNKNKSNIPKKSHFGNDSIAGKSISWIRKTLTYQGLRSSEIEAVIYEPNKDEFLDMLDCLAVLLQDEDWYDQIKDTEFYNLEEEQGGYNDKEAIMYGTEEKIKRNFMRIAQNILSKIGACIFDTWKINKTTEDSQLNLKTLLLEELIKNKDLKDYLKFDKDDDDDKKQGDNYDMIKKRFLKCLETFDSQQSMLLENAASFINSLVFTSYYDDNNNLEKNNKEVSILVNGDTFNDIIFNNNNKTKEEGRNQPFSTCVFIKLVENPDKAKSAYINNNTTTSNHNGDLILLGLSNVIEGGGNSTTTTTISSMPIGVNNSSNYKGGNSSSIIMHYPFTLNLSGLKSSLQKFIQLLLQLKQKQQQQQQQEDDENEDEIIVEDEVIKSTFIQFLTAIITELMNEKREFEDAIIKKLINKKFRQLIYLKYDEDNPLQIDNNNNNNDDDSNESRIKKQQEKFGNFNQLKELIIKQLFIIFNKSRMFKKQDNNNNNNDDNGNDICTALGNVFLDVICTEGFCYEINNQTCDFFYKLSTLEYKDGNNNNTDSIPKDKYVIQRGSQFQQFIYGIILNWMEQCSSSSSFTNQQQYQQLQEEQEINNNNNNELISQQQKLKMISLLVRSLKRKGYLVPKEEYMLLYGQFLPWVGIIEEARDVYFN